MKWIIIGVILIGVGVAVIYRHRDLYKAFGNIEWAEKAFGDSLIVYPLVGTVFIVVGILFLFGMGGNPGEIDATLGG